ncbi:MAG TPA: hypothetical protein VIY70_11835, partial [Acidimicrobiia bacterium]
MGIPAPAVAATTTTIGTGGSLNDFVNAVNTAQAGDIIEIVGSGDPLNPRVIQLTQTLNVNPGTTIRGVAADPALLLKSEQIEIRAPASAPAFRVLGPGTVNANGTPGTGAVFIESLEITGADDRRATGGAIGVDAGAALILRKVSLNKNKANDGGGIHNAGTTYVYDSVFY